MGTLQTVAIAQAKRAVESAPARESGDLVLVRAYRDGSREAAETLVSQSYGLVYASLHRMCRGDRELASDLTQETYRKAWQSLASYDGRARFASWLYRIAYHTFLNHLVHPHLQVYQGVEVPGVVLSDLFVDE